MGDVVLICDQWVRGMTLETSQVLDGARFGSAIDFGAADPRQQMSSLRPEVGSLRGGCGGVSGSVRMAAQPHGILPVLGVGLMLPASPPLHNRGFIKVSRAGFPVRSVAAMRARRRPARPAAGPPTHRTS